jgi:hypothetical protein
MLIFILEIQQAIMAGHHMHRDAPLRFDHVILAMTLLTVRGRSVSRTGTKGLIHAPQLPASGAIHAYGVATVIQGT